MQKQPKTISKKDLILFLQKCEKQNYKFLFIDVSLINLIGSRKNLAKGLVYNYEQISIEEIIKVFSNNKKDFIFKESGFDRTYLCFDLLDPSDGNKRIRIYVDGSDNASHPSLCFYIKALFFFNLDSRIETMSIHEAFNNNLLNEEYAKFFILNMSILLDSK